MITEPRKTMTIEELEEEVVRKIKTVYDPEIPVNVYDLGLIYGVTVNPDMTVLISMTLTTPNCPAAGILPGEVEMSVKTIDDVVDAADVCIAPGKIASDDESLYVDGIELGQAAQKDFSIEVDGHPPRYPVLGKGPVIPASLIG